MYLSTIDTPLRQSPLCYMNIVNFRLQTPMCCYGHLAIADIISLYPSLTYMKYHTKTDLAIADYSVPQQRVPQQPPQPHLPPPTETSHILVLKNIFLCPYTP